MKKRLHILGSTGSIGQSAFRVIQAFPNRFEVVLLAARGSVDRMQQQALALRPEAVCLTDEEAAQALADRLHGSGIRVLKGESGLRQGLNTLPADMTLSAMVGVAGLQPTLAAIRAGTHIALANKESMVVAGPILKREAARHDVAIIPVDSEHNALHQCLKGESPDEVKRLILTASGGPFRDYQGDFDAITPEQALNHPTWRMGPKISIDSATMMNKGLEVIEAHQLFDFPGARIDIAVHPQSVVHSMIETVDGSLLCQMGKPDMAHAIQYAFSYPERWPDPFDPFDLSKGWCLEFFPVDLERFPCIRLAYQAMERGPCATTALNAANEVAVDAFLRHALRFSGIPNLISACLDRLQERTVDEIEDLLDLDRTVRETARSLLTNRG